MVAKTGQLPVPNFSAGGIATPADAAMMMQLGAQTVFVGSGIFMKEGNIRLDVSLHDEESAKLFGAKPGEPVNPAPSVAKRNPAPKPSSAPPPTSITRRSSLKPAKSASAR